MATRRSSTKEALAQRVSLAYNRLQQLIKLAGIDLHEVETTFEDEDRIQGYRGTDRMREIEEHFEAKLSLSNGRIGGGESIELEFIIFSSDHRCNAWTAKVEFTPYIGEPHWEFEVEGSSDASHQYFGRTPKIPIEEGIITEAEAFEIAEGLIEFYKVLPFSPHH